MQTEASWIFKDEYLLTWSLCQEINRGLFHTTPRYRIRQIFGLLVCVTVLRAAFHTTSVVYGLWLGCAAGALIDYLRKHGTKNGDKHYKEQIQNNGGKEPHVVHTYYEDKLISTNQHTKESKTICYSQIVRIIESKRVFLLITDAKECVIVDTLWLSGGNRDEFRSFIEAKCTTVRGKIKTGRFSRILQTVLRTFPIAVAIVTLFVLHPGILPQGNGTLSNDLTYREIAVELNELGITCSEEMIKELEEMESTYQDLSHGSIYTGRTAQDKVMSLLSWAGFGNYDFDTFEWTPSSCGVYWIDMEALHIETMYTDYLRGIESLSDGALTFTSIEETYDSVNWEKGTGFGQLTFALNGKTYHVLLEMDADWYSADALKQIGAIINSQKSDKKLYYLSDFGQGFLIFYRDAQWAREFTNLTGLPLTTNFSQALNQTIF